MTGDVTVPGKPKKPGKPPREFSPEELEIRELVALCKAGKLFDIQQWIAAGRRVNPPPHERKGPRPEVPLNVAIDLGFHSLVEVLLKGGAAIQSERWTGSMDRALRMRRFDLVQLLVDFGFDPRTIDMDSVFHTWDPDIIEYFIDRGADVETGGPLTNALRQRIRTALRIFKRYQDKFPHFQKQIDAALRYHCQEGNEKWVSLLLWAGADPYSTGGTEYEPQESDDDSEIWCALQFATLHGHFHLFRLRGLVLKPDHPALPHVIGSAVWKEGGFAVAERLIKMGVNPNDQENGGCSEIRSLISGMSWGLSYDSWGNFQTQKRNIDDEHAREKMRAIHFLVKHGARWHPTDAAEISDARRSLVKMTPDYALEFVWIMSKFRACSKDSILELVRTPRMKTHLTRHSRRLGELLEAWTDASEVAKCASGRGA